MKDIKKEIVNYFINTRHFKEEDTIIFEGDSTILAQLIAEYAHKGQTRPGGESYFRHPERIAKRFIEITCPSYCKHKQDKRATQGLEQYSIPYKGVIDLCYLHDVVEDTEVTHDDIKYLYHEFNLGEYFDEYIDMPLKLLTKNTDDYGEYISLLIKNPTAAIVKYFDLIDNITTVNPYIFPEERVKQLKKYFAALSLIEYHYHFIDNFNYFVSNYR